MLRKDLTKYSRLPPNERIHEKCNNMNGSKARLCPKVSAPKTRVLIADDHPLMRCGIKESLERYGDFEIVGEASDGQGAVELARDIVPDVVVMDINMPKMSSIEATRQIKSENSGISVLIFTVHEEQEFLTKILEAGADGYLLKRASLDRLAEAIKLVKGGEMSLYPRSRQPLLINIPNKKEDAAVIANGEWLTEREIGVLRLASKGMKNKEIAAELGIGVRTVRGYLASIFDKSRTSSRTEAVLYALKQGWIL